MKRLVHAAVVLLGRDKDIRVMGVKAGKCDKSRSGRHVIDRGLSLCIFCVQDVDTNDYSVTYAVE